MKERRAPVLISKLISVWFVLAVIDLLELQLFTSNSDIKAKGRNINVNLLFFILWLMVLTEMKIVIK
ncbi:MAG: hypothetical protein IPN68_02830 [Bacteroidetes bacterium]|nr:hypothetical protein [Bacteroidota bacterium]